MEEVVEVFSEENKVKEKSEKNIGEDGVSTVEIILILVVLIALVVIFKAQIIALVNSIFTSINNNAAGIYR